MEGNIEAKESEGEFGKRRRSVRWRVITAVKISPFVPLSKLETL